MERQQLEQCEKRLHNHWLLVGPWMRRRAVRQLAADSSAKAVPLLVEALADADEQVRVTADAALRGLTDRDAIDTLCALWVDRRDARLRAILHERSYMARQPVRVRVLSALLVNHLVTDAEAVPFLVEALADTDEQVKTAAVAGLKGLTTQEAIDTLCTLWVARRTAALRVIIREQGYVAHQSAKVRVLSSLLVNHPATDAEVVPLLVEALADVDEQVRVTADAALRGLTEREAIDMLCQAAIREPDGLAAKICVETGKRPSDPEEACLLLFVTRQLDTYFQEDFKFQHLHLAHDRATEEVKAHVMEVVRSGDRRVLDFFGSRKPLSECSESEISLAIESVLTHRDWPRLFRAFQELPLKYGFPLLAKFRDSGWEPEQDDLKSLYRGVLAESNGKPLPPHPSPAQETSSVFERWLAEGRGGEWSGLGETELLQRLQAAALPDGVKIVAALATKSAPGSEAARTVRNSPHWPVRLAGYATGLCWDLAQDGVKDDNHWVNGLVGAVPVLEFWPVKATPGDLDALNAAPREAFVGKYGAVRRVLRVLLAHRVTTPEVSEVVFEAGEFTGEFKEA
jgi:hypothetical protein